MITRIELHNFMSHRSTVIEPSPGLTVLVGPNNCGKSAVVAALQVVSQNKNSKLFTRHGEKLSSVVIHTSEGDVIEWRRKDSPSYRVNGQVFDRLGRSGVPEEVQPRLRLPTVGDEDDDSFNIHFGNQKSPIFLLDSSPATAAKFFASSSDAIRLVEMQQRHSQQVADSRRQRKQLEAEAEVVNAELEALNATVPLGDQLSELEQLHSQVARLELAINDLDRATARLVERGDRVELHTSRTDALRPLAPPPDMADPQPIGEVLKRLDETRRTSERLIGETRVLGALPTPPEIDDVAALEQLLTGIVARQARISRLDRTRQAVAPLQAPPALSEWQGLELLIRQLRRATADEASTAARCDRLAGLAPLPHFADASGLTSLLRSLEQQTRDAEKIAALATSVSKLASPPELADDQPLAVSIEKLAAAERQIAGHRESLASLESELERAAASMRDAVRGQSCPTCGQAFDAEQLLAMTAGGHAHG